MIEAHAMVIFNCRSAIDLGAMVSSNEFEFDHDTKPRRKDHIDNDSFATK
jgi:hypothetical protein